MLEQRDAIPPPISPSALFRQSLFPKPFTNENHTGTVMSLKISTLCFYLQLLCLRTTTRSDWGEKYLSIDWSFHFLTLYVYLVFSLSHLFQAADNGSVNSESVCSKRGKTNQNHCKIQIVWKDSNNLSVSDSNYLTVLDSKYLSVSDSKYLTVLDPRYPTVLVLNIRLFQILNSRDFADHPNPFTEPAGFRGMFPPSLDGPITPITNILSILLH